MGTEKIVKSPDIDEILKWYSQDKGMAIGEFDDIDIYICHAIHRYMTEVVNKVV